MELEWLIVISLLSLYLITSMLLFLFPTLLHQSHHCKFPSMRIIAHRGGAGEYIENTMPAFDHAISLGVDMLEIDVQITKDGVVVVAHDNQLLRSTGVTGGISETEYENLPKYKSDLPLQFDRTRCSSEQEDLTFVKLDNLFVKHTEVLIHIDTKEGCEILAQSVSELVVKHGRQRNTIWGNMSQAKQDILIKIDPKIHMFMSIRKVALTYITFYLGTIGFLPMRESVFDIPMPGPLILQFSEHLSPTHKVMGHVINCLMMNRILFWHLRRRGIRVNVFVLNYDRDFSEAVRYHVDGIMTDYPTKLVDFYAQNLKLENGSETTEFVPNSSRNN